MSTIQANPSNIEAEQALLGAILLNNEILGSLRGLEADHFYEPVHGRIFALASQWIGEGRLASPVTLKPSLCDDEGLRELGGPVYLARLAGSTISIVAAPDYAKIVREMYGRRAVIEAAELASIRASSFGEEGGVVEAMIGLDEDLDAIRGFTQTKAPSITFAQASVRAAERMLEAQAHGGGEKTGLAAVDSLLGGLYPGDLILLAGRPSMGKTALAISIARSIAARGVHVKLASLEMQEPDIAMRMVSESLRVGNVKIPYRDIRAGTLQEHQVKTVLEGYRDMEALPIDIIGPHVRRLQHLIAEIRRTVKKSRAQGHPVGVIIIDYLGLIQCNIENDNSRMSAIVAAVKGLAAELGVAIIALSQLNRKVEDRNNKRPLLNDLRDSGSLEQDADTVLFVYRAEYYLQREEPQTGSDAHPEWMQAMDEARGKMDIICAKQRNGAVGSVTVDAELETNSFWDEDEGNHRYG
jgi:replicative DNA helicase